MPNQHKLPSGWENTCCICLQEAVSWNNPDPIRDGNLHSCCTRCNRLVIAARMQLSKMPKENREAYIRLLRGMSHRELVQTLPEDS